MEKPFGITIKNYHYCHKNIPIKRKDFMPWVTPVRLKRIAGARRAGRNSEKHVVPNSSFAPALPSASW